MSEEEQNLWDLRMAVYAAMVYRMDQGIGNIIKYLKQTNQLDNTLIMFLSDNGACPEPIYEWDLVHSRDGQIGSESSFDAYGYAWANASNTPFKLFKSWTTEGGIRTPFIAHWPKLIKPGQINSSESRHIIDLMPTCLDVSGTTYPKTFMGNPLIPFEGKSLLESFKGFDSLQPRTLYWEHEGNRAVREGKWKLVYTRRSKDQFVNKWTLFNIEEDLTEVNDISAQFPKKAQQLKSKYESWAKRVGVENWDEITKWD